MKKFVIALNIILADIVLLMIINYQMNKLVEQEKALQLCEVQKKEMREAYSDLYDYYTERVVKYE